MRKLAGFVSLFLLILGCRGKGSVPAGSRETPVIIISIDTLRSDHLPAYGYNGVQTPNLDSFRAGSILYERAYTHCPLTFPAHASLLTGRYPADTGVRDNVGYQLSDNVPTLAETLRKNGYATGAAISAFVLRKETRLDRGFDFYDDGVHAIGASQVIGRIQREGGETIAVAKKWIDEQKKPVFFFLHLYEPHTPYDPPEPYKSKYASAYDGEIAHVDQIVGDFLDHLKSSGVYDRALIIITSDHGEGLNDHKEEEHGVFLYREAIQIPLLVKLPGGALKGDSIAAPAQLVDIFPTVLAQAGSGAGVAPGPGMSLIELRKQSESQYRKIYSETYYPRFHFGWSDLHSITDGSFHYIQAPAPELYDLASDPAERSNVLSDHRRIYAAMRREIEPMIRQADAPAAVDPEERAKLAALGYLGSTVQTAPGEELPDPKLKIDTFREIRVAFTHFRDERFVEALAIIDRLLAENRRMLDLWDLKSKCLMRVGRLEESLEAAKEGLRLQPNATHVVLMVANVALDLHRLDEAQQHAELALKGEPGQARELLARIWLERGDSGRAEKEARAAIAAGERDRPAALLTLARVYKARNDFPGTLRQIELAEAAIEKSGTNRRLTNLHFLKGDVLARVGRNREAEQEFREEIRLFPSEPNAYKTLILLLVTEGRGKEATQLVFDLIKASPTAPSYLAICQTLEVLGDGRGVRYWARQGLQKFPADPKLRKFASG